MEQGKGAGITLCQILNCLETNRQLPSQNSALLCTRARGPSEVGLGRPGGQRLVPRVCVSPPRPPLSTTAAACKRNVCFAKQRAERLQRTNTAEPDGKGTAGGDETEVRVCLDLDLGVFFLHLRFTEIANAELEGGCRSKHML